MVRNYFFIDDQNMQRGPFSAETLLKEGITKNTLVWYEGASDWTPAANVYELVSMMDSMPKPPPFPGNSTYGSDCNQNSRMEPRNCMFANDVMPKTWFLESILVTILCCLPLGIAGIYFASKVEPTWRLGESYDAKRYSKNAKICVIISLILFAIGLLIYLMMFSAMWLFNPLDML